MYNKFAHKTIRKSVTLYIKLIIQQKQLDWKTVRYFYSYFKTFSVPTVETLFLLVLSILARESADSIRSLYRHFQNIINEIIEEFKERRWIEYA